MKKDHLKDCPLPALHHFEVPTAISNTEIPPQATQRPPPPGSCSIEKMEPGLGNRQLAMTHCAPEPTAPESAVCGAASKAGGSQRSMGRGEWVAGEGHDQGMQGLRQ